MRSIVAPAALRARSNCGTINRIKSAPAATAQGVEYRVANRPWSVRRRARRAYASDREHAAARAQTGGLFSGRFAQCRGRLYERDRLAYGHLRPRRDIYPEFASRFAACSKSSRRRRGSFELKEHFAASDGRAACLLISLWRLPPPASTRARKALTAMLAFITRRNFLVGHVVNNFRGFGA
jgi:hypothetical protein